MMQVEGDLCSVMKHLFVIARNNVRFWIWNENSFEPGAFVTKVATPSVIKPRLPTSVPTGFTCVSLAPKYTGEGHIVGRSLYYVNKQIAYFDFRKNLNNLILISNVILFGSVNFRPNHIWGI